MHKLSVNKCFLAKSPVGSLPFVHREFPIVGKFPCERGFYRARRQRRETLLAEVILGFTNLFCSAKQIREEVSPQIFSFGKSSRRIFLLLPSASQTPPSEREARKESAATPSRRGQGKSGNPGKYSLRHGTEASFGCRDTSLEEGGKKGECGNSFRPFGAPPSEREARKESAATLSKMEAREGRAHKRGQRRRGNFAAAPRVIQVWFRAQASASRSSALTKASLPSQYASMS